MKASSLFNAVLFTGVFAAATCLALATALGLAQSAPAVQPEKTQANSSDRKLVEMLTVAQPADQKPLGSAQEPASLNATSMGKNELDQIAEKRNGSMSGAQHNPMYSSKDKAAGKPAAKPHEETVEYKDPEDMTTRYRPGNNKTARTDSGTSSAASSSATPAKPHSSSH
ncbi:MAG TPA: hypothetical protein VK716_13385 [Terracidiphilus sp.]|jgi:hypothetical protein|nr:hypothetical protein [Terracidiphilus sp.]